MDTSIVSKINRSASSELGVEVDYETEALLNYAQTCYEQSDGLFDITSGALRKVWDFRSQSIPSSSQIEKVLASVGWQKLRWAPPKIVLPLPGMEIDFGGVVKEYVADSCANVCKALGVAHGIVNLSGDIHAIGPHPDGSPWAVAIQDPRDEKGKVTTIPLYQGGLASSGDYQRCIVIDNRVYSHLLNPKTGWPVHGLMAASVLAETCVVAGSTSTIAMLKAEEGLGWLESVGFSFLCVDDKRTVHCSGIELN